MFVLGNTKEIQIKYGAPSTPGKLSGVEVMFPAPALASMLRIELALANEHKHESYVVEPS